MRLERVLEEARAKGYPIEDNGLGNLWVVLPRERFKEEMAHYKAMGFNFLADIVGLDYLTYPDPRPERFAVVYELVSSRAGRTGTGAASSCGSTCPKRTPGSPRSPTSGGAPISWKGRSTTSSASSLKATPTSARSSPRRTRGPPPAQGLPLGRDPHPLPRGAVHHPGGVPRRPHRQGPRPHLLQGREPQGLQVPLGRPEEGPGG